MLGQRSYIHYTSLPPKPASCCITTCCHWQRRSLSWKSLHGCKNIKREAIPHKIAASDQPNNVFHLCMFQRRTLPFSATSRRADTLLLTGGWRPAWKSRGGQPVTWSSPNTMLSLCEEESGCVPHVVKLRLTHCAYLHYCKLFAPLGKSDSRYTESSEGRCFFHPSKAKNSRKVWKTMGIYQR